MPMLTAGMTSWSNEQYLKFAVERTRPAQELLARVPIEKPHRVLDLGCGPGNSTELLSERWPYAEIVGVDSSSDMLDRARRDHPDLNFIQADASTYRPERPVDLLFSNALLQWLPDHERPRSRAVRLCDSGRGARVSGACQLRATEPSPDA